MTAGAEKNQQRYGTGTMRQALELRGPKEKSQPPFPYIGVAHILYVHLQAIEVREESEEEALQHIS